MQIYTNAGVEFIKPTKGMLKKNEGLDIKTGDYGDLIKLGVIDPLKVTKHALQNAVSVAVTILSTNAIVTMARTYESK